MKSICISIDVCREIMFVLLSILIKNIDVNGINKFESVLYGINKRKVFSVFVICFFINI